MNKNKYYSYFLLLNHWLESKQYGHCVAEYFQSKQISTIAIYGMGDLANRLIDDLKESEVHVVYGIDGDIAASSGRIAEVYSLDDELTFVDAIIVTPFQSYDAIKQTLENKISTNIISIEEVVWSI